MSAEENLKKLGLTLPNIPTPVANYVPWKRDGNTIYLSGQGPRDRDGKHITGTVGKDVTVEQAYQYAQLVGLNLLAAAKAPVSPPLVGAELEGPVFEKQESAASSEELAPLFLPDVSKEFRARWDAVQIGFVDDPQRAVREADELVAQVMESLA